MHENRKQSTWVRRRIRSRALPVEIAAMLVLLLLGCSGPASTQGPGGPLACPTGHIPGPKGDCMPVGIQGCADMFLEEDGLCRPSIDKCPAGTIPKFTEGCVPVGIQGCAGLFMEDDGLCHPSIDKCPAGTIPKFDEGCVPVGIPSCAPEFMEADGICHPRMAKCPAGTFAVPQKGCLPIDGPAGCGSGTWGNITDAPNTVYVDPTYPGADSDGSKSKPVTTIAAAMALVASGGRVALAAGTYPEGVKITKTMTLEGRCPSMVRIEGNVPTNSNYPAVVFVLGASGVTLRGVEIGGAAWGIEGESSPGLVIDGVHVRNATDVGIDVWAGTTVSISNSFIDSTLRDSTTNLPAFGLWIDEANATLNETTIFGNDGIGILVSDGAELTATDVLVEGTLHGRGLEVQLDSHALLDASAIVANVEVGLLATGSGTDVTAQRTLIEDTLPGVPSKADGRGIMVQQQAKGTLTGNIVLKNRYAGICLSEADDTTISGNLILDTLPEESTQSRGFGLFVHLGAHTIVNDNAIIGNHSHGIFTEHMPTQVTVSRNLVEGTLSTGPMNADLGLGVQMCSSYGTLTENALVRNRSTGLVICSGTNATASGNLIEGTLPWETNNTVGYGIFVMDHSTATLTGNVIVQNRGSGLSVEQELASVTASGNLVRDTLPQESDQLYGNGIQIGYGAHATLNDNTVLENGGVGIIAEGINTQVSGAGNLIQRTLGTPDGSDGAGVAVSLGARGWFSQNAVLENHVAGFLAGAAGSELVAEGDLVEGTLAEQLRGVSGLGISCQTGARCTVTSALVRDNQAIGILLFQDVTGQISRSAVRHTMMGAFAAEGSAGITYTDIGDGIVADGSSVEVTDTLVHDCARAGILFNASSGSIAGVSSQNNQFGLVLQGATQPSYAGAGNVFEPNQKQNVVIGGNLPVPNEALPVPESSPTPPMP